MLEHFATTFLYLFLILLASIPITSFLGLIVFTIARFREDAPSYDDRDKTNNPETGQPFSMSIHD